MLSALPNPQKSLQEHLIPCNTPTLQVEEQGSSLARVGTESMNMREAMKVMKEQAGQMAVAAEKQRKIAAEERAEADSELASVAAALEAERQRVANLEVKP